MSSTAATGVDTLVGQKYVLDRWAELAGEPEWWARSDGIGLRLRVAEMMEVARLFDTGALTEPKTVGWVFEVGALAFAPGTYAATNCPGAAKMVADDFMRVEGGVPQPITSPTAYRPDEQRYGSLHAIHSQLSEQRYRDDLLTNIARAASKCGWDVKRIDALDEFVALYDAEFIADGHSPSWRRQVAERAQELWDQGTKPLTEAISDALDERGHSRKPRKFDVLVPVFVKTNPRGSSPGRLLTDSSGAGFPDLGRQGGDAILRGWGAAGGGILARDEFVPANRYFRYEVDAADADAAAAAANERFRADADLWHLLDGELEEPHEAAVRDTAAAAGTAGAFRLPPRPLRLAPDELVDGRDRVAEIPKLQDAIAQVAQARMAVEGAALVDLWTAVEALFGDNDHGKVDAGFWIADATPFPYVRHVSQWLGTAISGHGYGTPPSGQELKWLHETVYGDRTAVAQLLVDKRDPLAWRRLNEVFDWEKGAFRKAADALRARYADAARRIYLIRNVAVHNAQLKSCTRAVTLPLFADLVRVSLGHVLRYADATGALAEVRLARAEVDDVIGRWAKPGFSRDDGLKQLLYRTPRAASP